ncbi:2587_t:CDS:2, partial [Racocetra fulgida]
SDTDFTTIKDDDSEQEINTRSITPKKRRTRSFSTSGSLSDDLIDESQLSSVGGSTSASESIKIKKEKPTHVQPNNNNRPPVAVRRKPGRPPKKSPVKQATPAPTGRKRGRPAGIKNRVQVQRLNYGNNFADDHDSQIIHRRGLNKLSLIEENDVFAKDNAGQTNLHRACQDGRLDMVKALINGGADVNIQDNAGLTPLHEAVSAHNYDIVKYLLEAGANPNIGESENVDTPLHDACSLGYRDIVTILIDYGADPDKTNVNNTTPKDTAKNNISENLLRLVNQIKLPNRCIVQQNIDARAEEESNILPRKVSVNNSKRSTRNTGKYYDRSRHDRIRNTGARGITSSNEVLRLDLTVDSRTGRSRLHHYTKLGHAEAVVGLLEMNAPVGITDKDRGRTPLHEAAIEGYHDIVGFLLAYKADINAQDKYGNTPLHYASFYGHGDVVKLLLQHKCILNIKNNEGKEPYEMARGREHIIQLLCQNTDITSDSSMADTNYSESEMSPVSCVNMELASELDQKEKKQLIKSDSQPILYHIEDHQETLIPPPFEQIYNEADISDLDQTYSDSDDDNFSLSFSDNDEPVSQAGPIYVFQFDPNIKGYPIVSYAGNEDSRFIIDIQIEKYLAWNRGSLAKKIDSSITRRLVTTQEKVLLWPLLNGEIWRGSSRSRPEEMESIKEKRKEQRDIGDLGIFPVDLVINGDSEISE